MTRALDLARTAGVRYAVDDLLEVYALLETNTGTHERAAQLLGTAAALREAMQVPLWGPLIERHARLVHELRSALGQDEFDTAYDHGRELPLEHWCEDDRVLRTAKTPA